VQGTSTKTATASTTRCDSDDRVTGDDIALIPGHSPVLSIDLLDLAGCGLNDVQPRRTDSRHRAEDGCQQLPSISKPRTVRDYISRLRQRTVAPDRRSSTGDEVALRAGSN